MVPISRRPWSGLPFGVGGGVPSLNTSGGQGVIPPPAPSPLLPHTPVIVRDPQQEPRTRRFTELVSNVINSLVGQGVLQYVRGNSWTTAFQVNPTVVARAPTIYDDASRGFVYGSEWIYPGVAVWKLIDPTVGAANWKQL